MPLLRDKDGFHLRLGGGADYVRLEPDGVRPGPAPQLLVITLLARQPGRGGGPKAIVMSGDLVRIRSAEGDLWLCIRDGAPATCAGLGELAATLRIESIPRSKPRFIQIGEGQVRFYVPDHGGHLRRGDAPATMALGEPDDRAGLVIERPPSASLA